MRYPNPHQQYGNSAMNPMQNATIQQQQQQLAQLQQQLLQQQAMANMGQMNQAQLQMMISNILSRNPQMAMMVQQNPQLLNNPQFVQQLLSMGQAPQQTMMNPQMQVALQQGAFQGQPQGVQQLQSDSYSGRFGGGTVAQQPDQPQQQFFQQENKQTESTPVNTTTQIEPPQTGIQEFFVNPEESNAVFNNSKFSITPKVVPFTGKMIETSDAVVVTEDLETAIKLLIERSNSSNKNTAFTTSDVIIQDANFKVPTSETLSKLFSGDVRQLYKTLKTLYNEIKSVEDLIMAERINAYLTDTVNHYLRITLDDAVNIGSFVEDFNDLLKVLRNNFEDAEDELRDYVQEEIEEINELLNSREESLKNNFQLVEGVTIVYYANHHAALGIRSVDNLVKIVDKPTNALLTGLAKFVFTDSQRSKFYLVTYDRRMYIISTNKDDEIFIEFVEAK